MHDIYALLCTRRSTPSDYYVLNAMCDIASKHLQPRTALTALAINCSLSSPKLFYSIELSSPQMDGRNFDDADFEVSDIED